MGNEDRRSINMKDLEELLGEEVQNLTTKSLTAPGDNYGSIMLAADVTLKSRKHVALVVKMFPLDEIALKLFHCPISMKKEIEVYKIISAEYEKIQEELSIPPSQRFHAFCNCPGARLTLGEYDEEQLADENSVLLLENLKAKGYRTGDRINGLDVKHTEFGLKHLAKLHATAVAIKLKKPLVFRNKLLKVLIPVKIEMATKEEDEQRSELFLESLKNIPACNKKINELSKVIKEDIEFAHSDKLHPIREPFATFVHADFWTNNMMFQYNSDVDEDPLDLKVVDFQMSHYGTPVLDIILFLFTSTQTGLVSEYIDHFLELYNGTFVDWLGKLGCDTKKFSYERFLEEVKIAAPPLLPHVMNMLLLITFSKHEVEKGQGLPGKNHRFDFNDTFILKVSELVNVFANKEWL